LSSRAKREAGKEIKMEERCERGKGKFDEEFVYSYSAWI
jgi:hypothetical protein